MSALERRLQVLLDDARYERLAREAEVSGRSVGAVVRQAIDTCFPADGDRRHAAGMRLLQVSLDADGTPAEPDWADIKDDPARELESRLT